MLYLPPHLRFLKLTSPSYLSFLNHIETQFIYPDLAISESDDNQVSFINDYFPIIKVDDALINSTKKELKNNPNKDIIEKIQNAKWLLRSVKKKK